jgi:hypothetical protein
LKVLETELNIKDKDTISFNKSIGSSDGTYFNFKQAVDKVEAWQLLSPVKAKVFGTILLNRVIHQHFKKDAIDFANNFTKTPKPFGNEEIVYGEKVINLTNHIRNRNTYPTDGSNYLANGEMGITIGRCFWKNGKYDKNPHELEVEFSSQKGYKYQFTTKDFSEENNSLELAYALTIHKAQGSQFDTVLLVIPEPCLLLSRELIYTALSRQVHKVVVMYQGHPQMLYNYSSDTYSATLQRLTNLFYKPNITQLNHKFFERNLIHCASDGQMLRSKSEVIIYQALLHYDKKPIYEYRLELNGVVKRPDFYINDAESGINYYWEHLGMLSDPNYKHNWEQKLQWYKQNDILPYDENEDGGENGTLIITEDDANGAISVKSITEKIEKIFDIQSKQHAVKEIIGLTTTLLVSRKDIPNQQTQVAQLLQDLTTIKKRGGLTGEVLNLLESIYEKIDEDIRSADIQSYYAIVKTDFEHHKRLDDNTLKFLASAYYLKNRFDEMNTEDYSPVIVQYSRAIENEILQKIYLTFYARLNHLEDKSTFLKEEVEKNSKSKIFAADLERENQKITLGTMQIVMGFVWNSSGKTLRDSKLFQLFREHILTIVHKTFLSKEIVDLLEEITKFRNDAAHVEASSKEKSELFLEKSTIFLKILMKSYLN